MTASCKSAEPLEDGDTNLIKHGYTSISSKCDTLLQISISGLAGKKLKEALRQADAFVLKKVKNIVDGCLKTGESFTDPSFGSSDDDVGGAAAMCINGQTIPSVGPTKHQMKILQLIKEEKIRWERPHYANQTLEILDNQEDEEDDNQYDENDYTTEKCFCEEGSLFVDSANSGDIIQGNLGDCWFLGALSVLATRVDLLSQVFWRGSQFEKYGIFICRFMKDFTWNYVIVDDRIPVYGFGPNRPGKPYFARCKDPNELWVPIVEKAYAKLHGNYESLIGGYIDVALNDLSGLCSEQIIMKAEHPGFCEDPFESMNETQIRGDTFWKKLVNYKKNGCLMGCSIQPDPKTTKGVVVEANAGQGLNYKHAYGLVDLGEITTTKGEKVRLVKIRNPWGMGEWNGAWSDESPERIENDAAITAMFSNIQNRQLSANAGMKIQLEIEGQDGKYHNHQVTKEIFEMDRNDGTFFISFADWMDKFTHFFAGLDFPDEWCGLRVQGAWDEQNCGGNPSKKTWNSNPTFKLTLKERSQLFISLSQADSRGRADKKIVPVSFHICSLIKTPDGYMMKEPLKKSAPYYRLYPREIRMGLESGKNQEECPPLIIPGSVIDEIDSDGVPQPAYTFKQAVSTSVTMEAGVYCLVPSCFMRQDKETGCTNMGQFWISVYSNKNSFKLEGGEIIAEEEEGDDRSSIISSLSSASNNCIILQGVQQQAKKTSLISSVLESSLCSSSSPLIQSNHMSFNKAFEDIKDRLMSQALEKSIGYREVKLEFQGNPPMTRVQFKRKLMSLGFKLDELTDENLSILIAGVDQDGNGLISPEEIFKFFMDEMEEDRILSQELPKEDDHIVETPNQEGILTVHIMEAKDLNTSCPSSSSSSQELGSSQTSLLVYQKPQYSLREKQTREQVKHDILLNRPDLCESLPMFSKSIPKLSSVYEKHLKRKDKCKFPVAEFYQLLDEKWKSFAFERNPIPTSNSNSNSNSTSNSTTRVHNNSPTINQNFIYKDQNFLNKGQNFVQDSKEKENFTISKKKSADSSPMNLLPLSYSIHQTDKMNSLEEKRSMNFLRIQKEKREAMGNKEKLRNLPRFVGGSKSAYHAICEYCQGSAGEHSMERECQGRGCIQVFCIPCWFKLPNDRKFCEDCFQHEQVQIEIVGTKLKSMLIAKIGSSESELANLQDVFNQMDVDKSGELSRFEFMEVLSNLGLQPSLSDKQMNELINQFDLNQDGVISYEEFKKWLVDDIVWKPISTSKEQLFVQTEITSHSTTTTNSTLTKNQDNSITQLVFELLDDVEEIIETTSFKKYTFHYDQSSSFKQKYNHNIPTTITSNSNMMMMNSFHMEQESKRVSTTSKEGGQLLNDSWNRKELSSSSSSSSFPFSPAYMKKETTTLVGDKESPEMKEEYDPGYLIFQRCLPIESIVSPGEETKNLWKLLDTNKDGHLQLSELHAFLQEWGCCVEEHVLEMLMKRWGLLVSSNLNSNYSMSNSTKNCMNLENFLICLQEKQTPTTILKPQSHPRSLNEILMEFSKSKKPLLNLFKKQQSGFTQKDRISFCHQIFQDYGILLLPEEIQRLTNLFFLPSSNPAEDTLAASRVHPISNSLLNKETSSSQPKSLSRADSVVQEDEKLNSWNHFVENFNFFSERNSRKWDKTKIYEILHSILFENNATCFSAQGNSKQQLVLNSMDVDSLWQVVNSGKENLALHEWHHYIHQRSSFLDSSSSSSNSFTIKKNQHSLPFWIDLGLVVDEIKCQLRTHQLPFLTFQEFQQLVYGKQLDDLELEMIKTLSNASHSFQITKNQQYQLVSLFLNPIASTGHHPHPHPHPHHPKDRLLLQVKDPIQKTIMYYSFSDKKIAEMTLPKRTNNSKTASLPLKLNSFNPSAVPVPPSHGVLPSFLLKDNNKQEQKKIQKLSRLCEKRLKEFNDQPNALLTHLSPQEEKTFLFLCQRLRKTNEPSSPQLLFAESNDFVFHLKQKLDQAQLELFTTLTSTSLKFFLEPSKFQALLSLSTTSNTTSNSTSTIKKEKEDHFNIKEIILKLIKKKKDLCTYLIHLSCCLNVSFQKIGDSNGQQMTWEEFQAHLLGLRNAYVQFEVSPLGKSYLTCTDENGKWNHLEKIHYTKSNHCTTRTDCPIVFMDIRQLPKLTDNSTFLSSSSSLNHKHPTNHMNRNTNFNNSYYILCIRESIPMKQETSYLYITAYDPLTCNEYQVEGYPKNWKTDFFQNPLNLMEWEKIVPLLVLGSIITPKLILQVFNKLPTNDQFIGCCQIDIVSFVASHGQIIQEWFPLYHELHSVHPNSTSSLQQIQGYVHLQLQFDPSYSNSTKTKLTTTMTPSKITKPPVISLSSNLSSVSSTLNSPIPSPPTTTRGMSTQFKSSRNSTESTMESAHLLQENQLLQQQIQHLQQELQKNHTSITSNGTLPKWERKYERLTTQMKEMEVQYETRLMQLQHQVQELQIKEKSSKTVGNFAFHQSGLGGDASAHDTLQAMQEILCQRCPKRPYNAIKKSLVAVADGPDKISTSAFVEVLHDFGMEMSESQQWNLFAVLDQSNKGSISIEDFLIKLCGDGDIHEKIGTSKTPIRKMSTKSNSSTPRSPQLNKETSSIRSKISTSNPTPPIVSKATHPTPKITKEYLEKMLPSGWELRFTESNRPYYCNHVARSTQWKHPDPNVEQLYNEMVEAEKVARKISKDTRNS